MDTPFKVYSNKSYLPTLNHLGTPGFCSVVSLGCLGLSPALLLFGCEFDPLVVGIFSSPGVSSFGKLTTRTPN